MKKASIVSIGNEILSGQTVGTNAVYLGRRLVALGMPVASCYTIGDDEDAILRTLKLAVDDADVILVTGGLGPTDDDLTRQALARFLGVELELDNELLERIHSFFISRDMEMPAKNRVQAYIPAGAKLLGNNLGTASGILAEVNDKLIAAMPGVPVEMKRMFEESVLAKLKELTTNQVVVVRKLKCFGTGESNIAELIGPLMERGRNPLINCTAGHGVITLHIIATAKEEARAEQMVEQDEALLQKTLGKLIYGTDEETLAEVVGRELVRQQKTIATAESCTGGLIAKLLTDIPGASRYFTHGWVVYANTAKTSELNVPVDLIERYGTVSKEVAEALAQSARKKANSDYAIGVTGIAGPTGGTDDKPVGLVYISVDCDANYRTERFVFSHNRVQVRFRAAQTALNMLRLRLEN